MIFALATFAFIIKLTNSLVFIFIFLLIFSINFRSINYKHLIIISILPLLWFFQNFNISGCLIWPIELTCFSNNDLAIYELYLIESFAKGDIKTQINTNGFGWISVWISNHSHKIIEKYLIFTLVVVFPIFYFLIKKK